MGVKKLLGISKLKLKGGPEEIVGSEIQGFGTDVLYASTEALWDN